MSVYHGKLLELLSIDKEADKSFLRLRLFFQKEVELLWEIDHYTAEMLEKVIKFDGIYKYRLSFNSSWDSSKKQFISFFTRTYRDQSERIYFSCSNEFVNRLNSIKRIRQISEAHSLSFLSTTLPIPKIEIEKEDIKPSFINLKFAWVTAVVIFIFSISTLFFINTSHSIENQSVVTIQAESFNKEIELIPEKEKLLSVVEEEEVDSADTSNQTSIPVIELNDVVTYSIPEGSVALTFDDGPSKYSINITDILNKYQVGGTFFFIGYNVKKYPSYVQYVKDHGYSIGSHSMNHHDLTTLSFEEQEEEIVQSIKLLRETISVDVNLFRPPYGSMNDITKDLLATHNKKIIHWNIDPKDWKKYRSKDIINHIRNSKVSGSIILLHESQAVVDALPQIIEYLQEENLQIVNLK